MLAPFEQYNICRDEFWKSTLQKFIETNVRIYTNFDEWNNKSFYPSNMFEFIHHPEYGCHDL
jgi:hypothetical protein